MIYDSAKIYGMFGVYFINKDTGFIGGTINKLFKTTDWSSPDILYKSNNVI
jgi:hypothetical protein